MVIAPALVDREHVVVEAPKGRAVFGFHHREGVGSDICHHPGRVAGRDFVDRLGLELKPADPLASSVRDDLRCPALGPFKEAPSVLAQDHVVTAAVALVEPQRREPVDDFLLVRRAVGGFREQRVEPCVGVEDRFPLRPATKVQGLGPVEEVLQVERPYAHAQPPRVPLPTRTHP